MKQRVIVCGLHRTGYKIFQLLQQQGVEVVGIHHRPIPNEQRVVVGDPQSVETLLAAGIREAQTLVLANYEDGENLAILMQARVLNPRIRIVNRLFNTSLGDRLDRTLPEHFSMSVAALAAPIFAFRALGNAAIGQLRLFNQTWPIHEEWITADHRWLGRPLSELWDDRNRMLIYYLPAGEPIDLVSAVLESRTLQAGDRLIVGTKPNMRTEKTRSIRLRMAKIAMGLRYLKSHSHALLMSTLVLLLVILGTTLFYVSSTHDFSPLDALYFSVSLITGSGDALLNLTTVPDSLKLFSVFTILIGTAIIGLSYALLNDFILGTRFDHFWEAVRIPHQNHYVICGLGGVGVQIVTHLRTYGHEVVVIEQDPNCRFLETVRSLKVPVIQGDASLPATLKAANFDRAQALLAVTSNDTANLEIALSAKSLHPKLPVIVRYQDPEFAWMAQLVFDFKAVLSPPELVAPAFAAAALGGRVLGNGMTAGSLWVALATLITPNHPFCGKRVQDMAAATDCVPLYLETRNQTIHGWDLLRTCLCSEDVLYLTIPANRLEQLWNEAPPQFARSGTGLG